MSHGLSAALLRRSCLADGTSSVFLEVFGPVLDVLDHLILDGPS